MPQEPEQLQESPESATETEEQGTEEAKPDTEESEQAEESEEELPPKSQAKVQQRIDELVGEIKHLRSINENLSKSVNAPRGSVSQPEPELSDEQLNAILLNPERRQFHTWAMQTLVDRRIGKATASIEQKQRTQNAMLNSYEEAVKDFPEIADKNSALWKEADQIYVDRGLASNPNGQYLAAAAAWAKQNRGVAEKATKATLNAKKATTASQLVSAKPGVRETTRNQLDKLMEEASGTAQGSPEWIRFLKAEEASRKKSA